MTELTSTSTLRNGAAPQRGRADYFPISSALDAIATARRADKVGGDIQAHRLLGQAVGILMERYEVAEDRALHCLLRVADARQVELCEVARVVVDRANARARAY